MTTPLRLHPDRLFPAEPGMRAVARELYAEVAGLPIVSPHGHCDPAWFAQNQPFANAADLLLAPDHYLFRMIHSQGVPLEAMGVPSKGGPSATPPREAWRVLAAHMHLFRGTPSAIWLDHVFAEVFDFDVRLEAATADLYFDRIGEALATPAFRPRALFERFGIELLATTEGPADDLVHHRTIRDSGWGGRVVTAYRPDAVIDAEDERFGPAMDRFAALSGCDVRSWTGYLEGHRRRRAEFIALGATSSDHGHPTAATADLSPAEAEALFGRIVSDAFSPAEAELFRAQMLTEMARMSLDDGLVLQLHPGSFRNLRPPAAGALRP